MGARAVPIFLSGEGSRQTMGVAPCLTRGAHSHSTSTAAITSWEARHDGQSWNVPMQPHGTNGLTFDPCDGLQQCTRGVCDIVQNRWHRASTLKMLERSLWSVSCWAVGSSGDACSLK